MDFSHRSGSVSDLAQPLLLRQPSADLYNCISVRGILSKSSQCGQMFNIAVQVFVFKVFFVT